MAFNFSSLSTSSTVFMMSTMSNYGVITCNHVLLSSQTGVRCWCGKFSMDAEAIAIKTLSMGEVRQIVASGFKLTHDGASMTKMEWT